MWMRMRRRTLLSGALLAAIAVLGAARGIAAAQAEPAPFGHACTAQNGVRFCPTETLAQRVPDLRRRAARRRRDAARRPAAGPFPTIVMLHGWGGNKTAFESSSPAGDGNETFDYNNVYYAQHGYAVVNYSARGWGNSCGSPDSREDRRLQRRLDPARRPALRGARHAVPARPARRRENHQARRASACTGISYGGGQSIELAYLKNRIRLPERRIRAVDEPERQSDCRSRPPTRAGRGRTSSTR